MNKDDIRNMTKYQLELYILKHKNRNGQIKPYLRLIHGNASKEDRELASLITYAQNRLRLM